MRQDCYVDEWGRCCVGRNLAATSLPDVTERYVLGRNPSVHKLANAQQAFVIIGAPIEFETLLRSQLGD